METVDDNYSMNNIEVVEHSEEVMTSTVEEEPAVTPPTQTITLTQPAVYSIPTLSIPVMQIVTLPSIQTPAATSTPMSSSLRNVRLFAFQPKPVVNGTILSNKVIVQQQPQTVVLTPTQFQGATKQQQITLNQILAKSKQQQPVPKTFQIQTSTGTTPKITAQSFYGNKYSNKKLALTSVKPNPQFWKEQRKAKELEEVAHLSPELKEAFKILQDLMDPSLKNNNAFFLDRVDPEKDGAPDYYRVITKPLWLNKIREKLKNSEYKDILEFATDVRVMLENCYRYNGPSHPITKKAMRMEQILEQKLGSLASDLREKCTVEKSFGPEIKQVDEESIQAEGKRLVVGGEPYFSYILHRVKDEREKREKELKEKLLQEQQRKREEKEKRIRAWAQKMMNEKVKREMRLMWEIPQIGHFLHLARKALHIGEIAQYELEHMFLMPEASVLLATLVTSLLSSPNQRVKLSETPPPEYSVWSAKLQSRVAEWFRAYNREGHNALKVFENLGIEPSFWSVCGDKSPLDAKPYHELSFLKRVWIFKTLCDVVMHSHKTVQEAMAEEEGPESREVILGQDSQGYSYLHFPAVSGSDIRVYRQSKWDLDMDPFWGPLCEQRRIEEEEKTREEEERLRKIARRVSQGTPKAKSRRKNQPKSASTTPAKTKKKMAQPSAKLVATRISPRTLQRHTGLSSYKETSDEEDDEYSAEEDETQEEEESTSDEEFETRLKRCGRKKTGQRKTLEKIKEEDEEEEEGEEDDEKVDEEEAENQDQSEEEIEGEEGKEERPIAEAKTKTEEGTERFAQGLTVSELMKKISESSSDEVRVKDEPQTDKEPKIEETEVKEEEDEDKDPDRPLFDPFYFELVISSVGELKEWIAKYEDQDGKPPSRSEVRLRNRLKALLEEAEPLAADQLVANEKICRHLWRQWDAHYNPEKDESSDSDGSCDEEAEEEENLSDEEIDDGLRHSKRLRKRKREFGDSEHSSRSPSPSDEIGTRPSKRGYYEEDPVWERDPEKKFQRKPVFEEHMKDPQYWRGRRVTRATAQFANSVPFDDEDQSVEMEENSSSQVSVNHETKEGTTTGELMNQLRQLRRQQAMLCSTDRGRDQQLNDSKAVNGSPALLSSKVSQDQAAGTSHSIASPNVTPRKLGDPVPAPPSTSNGIVPETSNSTPQSAEQKQPVKLIIVNNTQPNSALGPDTLARILGPEARTGKLSVVKTATGGKKLVLILADGSVRQITASQLSQIQDVLRSKRDSAKEQPSTST